MKRLLLAVVVISAASLTATMRDVRNAYACSGPPTHQQMAVAPTIVEGRITSAVELPAESDRVFRAFEVTIAVTAGHKNAVPGATLAVRTQVPTEVPVMCPQWDRSETFTGKHFIGSVQQDSAGRPSISRWGTAFLGLEAQGSEYELGLGVLRLAMQGEGGGPMLRVSPNPIGCGGSGSLTGARFTPGASYDVFFAGTEQGTVAADAVGNLSGRITAGGFDDCERGYDFSFVEVWPSAERETRFLPAASLRLPVSAAPGPPDVGTGLALRTGDASLPWSDVVLVVILVMAFAGGTVAIVRSARRR